jgi:crotonobetainyl-CoA:carnitine CoA-transferase CaiB-like acyl-CoA transferase
MDSQNFFKHLTVIELAGVLAGPFVGRFFCEHGARVRKIENPLTGGDVTRGWKTREEDESELSAYYISVNQGKEVMWLNLKQAADEAQFLDLLKHSDILLTNFKDEDGISEKVNLHYLSEAFPHLIIGQIDGYPPGQQKPAYDMVLQADCGYLSLCGVEEGKFARIPVAFIDVLAGHQLKTGILMALMQKMRLNKGCTIRVNLWETALCSLINQSAAVLKTGVAGKPMGTLHPGIAPYGEYFECADGRYILLAVGNDAQFIRLCKELELDEVAKDERFLNNALRVKNRDKLSAGISKKFSKHSSTEWLSRLTSKGVPAGVVRNLSEIFTSPEVLPLIHSSEMDGQPERSIPTSCIHFK